MRTQEFSRKSLTIYFLFHFETNPVVFLQLSVKTYFAIITIPMKKIYIEKFKKIHFMYLTLLQK